MMEIRILAFAVVMSALVTGCGERREDSGSQLTAADLARLTDFHAWKASLPSGQGSVKAIRLMIVNRRNGTEVTKSSTGDNLGTNCSSFLSGMRVDEGKFTGHLLTRNADGGGLGWNTRGKAFR